MKSVIVVDFTLRRIYKMRRLSCIFIN